MEVCLDGLFGQGYRKLVSAIRLAWSLGKARKGLCERAVRAGKRENGGLSRIFYD